MTPLRVCPSTLADGFDTYSPAAQKALFDGKAVSPFLDIDTPAANTAEAKAVIKNIGHLSLSGVQAKFGMVVDDHARLRYAKPEEQSTHIL